MERIHRRASIASKTSPPPAPPPPPSPSPSASNKTREVYSTEEQWGDGNEELLTLPAGWMVKLVAFQVELLTSCLLSIIGPFLTLFYVSLTIPSRIARCAVAFFRRLAFGLVGAAYAIAVVLAVMLAASLLGVALVRLWVEEPVSLRKQLHFDYTQAHPSAAVVLRAAGQKGRAVPAGHTTRVSLMLHLPESDHNRRIGVFQVNAEAVSSTGEILATSSQPCMLRFRSFPVQTMRTTLMSVPLLLGICSESQKIVVEILRYKESKRRSEMIRVMLKQRAGTADLPQLYEAEIIAQSHLPWAKKLVYNWRRTFYVWVSLYIYIVLLILLLCCFKPFVTARVRSHGIQRPVEREGFERWPQKRGRVL